LSVNLNQSSNTSIDRGYIDALVHEHFSTFLKAAKLQKLSEL